jgi:glycine/serine hydroxymethyltransferase
MGDGIDGVVTHGNFAAKGMPEIRNLINEACEKANKMLGAEFTILNCLSGVHGMICGILSTTKPGDTVMTVNSHHGGHFATKPILELTGRKQVYAEYDFNSLTFDVEKTAEIFKKFNCKALYLDVSVYLNPHPIRKLREALGNDAVIIYDASHTLGLIMGKEFQSPIKEGADVICANTHKTLPGPHRGMIAFRNKSFGETANAIISSSLYSTVHTNSLLALAVTIIEMYQFGKDYAKQIVKNSNALGNALVNLGFDVRKADQKVFSKNHQVHLYTTFGNRDIVRKFLDNNISINTSKALGEQLFIRIGTQEITRRGMKEPDMKTIAKFIKEVIQNENIKDKVIKFNDQFRKVHYCYRV